MDAMAIAQQQLMAQAAQAIADPNLLAAQQQQALQMQQQQQALQQQQLLQQQQQSALVAQHQSAMAAQQQVKLVTDDGQNPKMVLNQFCTAFCGRILSKEDITYTVNKFGVQFQAICKLACLGGQEVVGHLCHNAVDAEKSAAMMCLEAYKEQVAKIPKDQMRLPAPTPQQSNVRNTPAMPAVDAAAIFAANAAKRAKFQQQQAQLQVMAQSLPPSPQTTPTPAITDVDMGGLSGGMAMGQQLDFAGMAMGQQMDFAGMTAMGQQQSLGGNAMGQQQQQSSAYSGGDQSRGWTLPQTFSPKMLLNTLGMKIAKRILKHGETTYDTQMQEGGVGYQSTVKLLWLPDEWKDQLWVGDICPTKQAAEQSAADQVLNVLQGDETLMKKAQERAQWKPLTPVVRDVDPFAVTGGKGKGKDGKDGMDDFWSKGKGKKGCSKGKPDAAAMDAFMWGLVGAMDSAWNGKGSKGMKGEMKSGKGESFDGGDSWDGKGESWDGKGGKGDDSWDGKGESWNGKSGKGDDSWGGNDSWGGKGACKGTTLPPWAAPTRAPVIVSPPKGFGGLGAKGGNAPKGVPPPKGDTWGGKGDSWPSPGGDSWGGKGKDSWDGSGGGGDSWSGEGESSWGDDSWNGKGESWKGDSGGKGETWGDKGSMDDPGGKGKQNKGSKSDLNFTRTRLTELPAYGEIVQFRDKFGWIKPAEEIQDDQGKKYDKLYFNMKDVGDGVSMDVGFLVQFHIYKDNAGVGAEDIMPL